MAEQLKYSQVREILREHMGKRFPVGSRIPSSKELQKELGVSLGTVNRALEDLVNEGLIERFKGRGSFVARLDKDIGLLWPGKSATKFMTSYSSVILHAVESEAESQGKHLLVREMRDYQRPEFVMPGATKVAGVLILMSVSHEAIAEYHKHNIPVVLIDPLVRTNGVPFVTSDHFSAARESVVHLVKLGHRRIVHVTVGPIPKAIPFRERVFGYEHAMQDAGLEEFCYIHESPPIEHQYRSAAEDALMQANAADNLLAMFERVQPTACCCYDDIVAAWVIRTCHDRGIRVPEDISVVGVNDTAMAEQIWPTLTTVHISVQEVAQAAVRMLNTMIQEGRLFGEGLVLPVRLVERASTTSVLTDYSRVAI